MQLVTAFVTLAATDDRPVEFYGKLLDRDPKPHVPGVYAEFQLDQLRLAIFYPKPENQPEFAEPAGSAVSLWIWMRRSRAARNWARGSAL